MISYCTLPPATVINIPNKSVEELAEVLPSQFIKLLWAVNRDLDISYYFSKHNIKCTFEASQSTTFGVCFQ